MVKAWYMDNNTGDPCLENHLDPPQFISTDELYKITVLDKIKRDRGYTYEDEITCSKECLPDFEKKLKMFYEEHLHTDEEIRLVVDGSGYFDVRDKNDKWIRIQVLPADMIIIPSGIYHRFTMDEKKYVRAKRLFIGEPIWTPHNRPGAEEMECRQEYLNKIESGEFIATK